MPSGCRAGGWTEAATGAGALAPAGAAGTATGAGAEAKPDVSVLMERPFCGSAMEPDAVTGA